jgi:hypothetical protein
VATEGALNWLQSTKQQFVNEIEDDAAFGDADDDGFFTEVGGDAGEMLGQNEEVADSDDGGSDSLFEDSHECFDSLGPDAELFEDPDCEKEVQEWFGKLHYI